MASQNDNGSLTVKSEPEAAEKKLEAINSSIIAEFSVEQLINEALDPNITPPIKINVSRIERPCYSVYDDFNDFGKPGVYYHGIKTDRKEYRAFKACWL